MAAAEGGWLARAFGRRGAAPRPDSLTYAVGDVHGRVDLLARLLERILAEAPGWEAPPDLVLLGDYIDRGPDSRAVLRLLAELAEIPDIRPVFLMGNHERMLLRFLADPAAGPSWLRAGGVETLASYRIAAVEDEADEARLAALSARLARALGPDRAFLEALAPWHLTGDLLCVHAAADPARPPGEQAEATLLWGHPDFARTRRRDGLWVIHGHTVVPAPQVAGRRIAIDTGAWFTDTLTAARLDGEAVNFLAAD